MCPTPKNTGNLIWKDMYKKLEEDSGNLGNINRGRGYNEKEKYFKIAFVCGYSGSGRTALITRLLDNYFYDVYEPSIQDEYCFYCDWKKKRVGVDILDDAAQEEYSAIRDQTLTWADGFMLFFTLNNKTSLFDLYSLKEKILRCKDAEKVPMVLIGCKADLVSERAISREEIDELAKTWGCPYVETSALQNINVREAFKAILHELTKTTDVSLNVKKDKKCIIC